MSNFVLTVVVARSVDADRFGTFALVFSAYFLLVGVMRAVVAEPFTVADGGGARTRASDAVGAALGIGLLAAPVIAIGGHVGGQGRSAALIMASGLPVLLAQDASRCLLLASRRSRAAFATDLVWVALQVVGMVAVAVTVGIRVESAIAIWTIGAAGSFGYACIALRCRPRLGGLNRWLRSHRALWPAFLVEHVAMMGSWQIAVLGLGVIAGVAEVAAVRGAQTLLGPVTMVYLMTPFLFIGEIGKRRAAAPNDVRVVWRTTIRLACALAVFGAVATVALATLPDRAGLALLGDTWGSASSIVVPMGIYVALTGLNLGALIGLRALAAVNHSRPVRLIAASIMVVASLSGAVTAGAVGFAVGAIVATGVATILWWTALRSALLMGMSNEP